MLILNQLSKSYGNETVLKNINLEFGKGLYALLAPNGAGKTTLIKILATLIIPSSGNIMYNGLNIVQMCDQYRAEIGYLPQQVGYYANYTPRQYLIYLGALKDIPRKQLNGKVGQLLDLVGLSDVADKKMRKFSGGMIQRVGIVGALLNDPQILLLDEPTAGLDPKERMRFKNIVSEISNDCTVILSTHITADIDFIANYIIMLKDHTVLYHDTAEQIRSHYKECVYEAVMPQSRAFEYRKQYLILSEQYDGNNVRLRFYHRGIAEQDWILQSPNLEDIFLIVYKEEEREIVKC